MTVTSADIATTRTCDPAVATTRSLLGWGAVAGPLFTVVGLTQALTRDGFDLRRHAWSVLENGSLGWIQRASFLLTGAMVVVFAIGVRRATGSVAVGRLLAVYGASLVAAGVFTADPVVGFPAGTTTNEISWHGTLHLAAGGIGFLGMVAACLVLGRRFTRAGSRGWALSARIVGIGFLAAFAGITTGSTAAVPPFVLAVVGSFAWLASLAVHLYKTV